MSQYRYVHIATHGLLDTERPGLSALVFSMVNAEGKPQNGFLRANDIYNLKLPAELVDRSNGWATASDHRLASSTFFGNYKDNTIRDIGYGGCSGKVLRRRRSNV